MVIVAARNVIKHVKHAMEEPPQTARLVHWDYIRMVIIAARNVIKYAKHVMEELPQIVRHV